MGDLNLKVRKTRSRGEIRMKDKQGRRPRREPSQATTIMMVAAFIALVVLTAVVIAHFAAFKILFWLE